MNGVTQARNKLTEESDRLMASWRMAQNGWHDQHCEEFSAQFLQEISAKTKAVLGKMNELAHLIDITEQTILTNIYSHALMHLS